MKQSPRLPTGKMIKNEVRTMNRKANDAKRKSRSFPFPIPPFTIPPFTISPIHYPPLPHLRVIGTNLPRPNARPLTFNTTPIPQRLCSLARIIAFDSSASTIASICGDTIS